VSPSRCSFSISRAVDEGGYVLQARKPGRAQTPRPKVQHPAARLLQVRAHRDRLAHPTLADGLGELFQRSQVELMARLVRVFGNGVGGQHHWLAGGLLDRRIERGQVIQLQRHG
jgi:hypothetical protein